MGWTQPNMYTAEHGVYTAEHGVYTAEHGVDTAEDHLSHCCHRGRSVAHLPWRVFAYKVRVRIQGACSHTRCVLVSPYLPPPYTDPQRLSACLILSPFSLRLALWLSSSLCLSFSCFSLYPLPPLCRHLSTL